MESANRTTETTEPSFRPTVRSWLRWPSVVERIQAGDPAGSEELYRMLKTAFYPQLWRQLGSQDLEDRIHEVWMMVYEAIMNGEVREPERLMGFVSTVVRRAIASQIKKIVRTRRRTTGTPQVDWLPDGQPDQETSLAEREQREVVRRVLAGLKPEEREILCRFYVSDQSAEQICFEMHITPTQFRVGKSRAFARFTAKGREMQGTVGAA